MKRRLRIFSTFRQGADLSPVGTGEPIRRAEAPNKRGAVSMQRRDVCDKPDLRKRVMNMDQKRIEAAVRELLLAIGENPDREGLLETPRRVAAMYEEVFSGLQDDPRRHLKLFQEGNNDEMVIVRDIPMYSMCEHHLLPFIGRAHIAYIPSDGRVIGLSKLARIVECFAKRPQLQERLTSQVADFLFEELSPQGVAVIVEAEHLCMTMRGARAAGALTQTSALRGRMRSDAKTRAEVLSLLRDGRSL